MGLRAGARCRSRGRIRCPAWPGRGGRRRPSCGTDAAAPADAAGTAPPDAATTPDAAGAASADAAASTDAAGAASADAAASEFSAAQHGWHAQHVEAVAPQRRHQAGPRNSAAARHGIAAAGPGNDASGRNARPRCWRPESAGGVPEQSRRRHGPSEPAAGRRTREWRGRPQPPRRFCGWRCQPAGWWVCQSSGGGAPARPDRPAARRDWSRRCHDVARHERRRRRPSRPLHAAPGPAQSRRSRDQALSSARPR